ncbi:hydrolase [Bifidobacterium pullorum]|uniref:Hydrolase n=1 Tax=Bifidobacterium pullorum TaxID=78448 RepID=A0A7V8KRP4_9BIFI|nr:hydrolase [Bifidobacterium pullorum]
MHHRKSTRRPGGWSRRRRLLTTLPIFIVLFGILVTVSTLTDVQWHDDATGRTITPSTPNTAVAFANPDDVPLPALGTYEVRDRYVTIDVTRASTGEVQTLNVHVREPVDAGNGLPGVVFLHGAGYGTCDNSFSDVAKAMGTAGIVTAVVDKPAWSTIDINRDYPASADAYDAVIDYIRGLDAVDDGKVGIYATSEGTWISSYLLQDDPDVAFQILLSPMVFTPRESLAFFVAQDFTLAGAHGGYQSFVRRVFNIDAALFGLTNLDIRTLTPEAYAIPTFVAYGSRDVMTAQVDGLHTILDMCERAGNPDVVIRSYRGGNHVLRPGDLTALGTPYAGNYVNDLIDWIGGTLAGLDPICEQVAGAPIQQSSAVPTLRAQRVATIYGVVLHILTLVLLIASAAVALVGATRRIRQGLRRKEPVFGFSHGFGRSLALLVMATGLTLLLFAVAMGRIIMSVVNLAWGGTPAHDPGIMYWSWPVAQVVCALVVWEWSGVLARLVEVASARGILRVPPRKGAVREIVTGEQPVLASRRLGRVMFWLAGTAMFAVLLVFAFWGLFSYAEPLVY